MGTTMIDLFNWGSNIVVTLTFLSMTEGISPYAMIGFYTLLCFLGWWSLWSFASLRLRTWHWSGSGWFSNMVLGVAMLGNGGSSTEGRCKASKTSCSGGRKRLSLVEGVVSGLNMPTTPTKNPATWYGTPAPAINTHLRFAQRHWCPAFPTPVYAIDRVRNVGRI